MLQDRALVIIPVYNEETTLKSVIEDLKGAGFANILVVNDGSTDASLDITKELAVEAVSHEVNLGVGAAWRTGFDYFLATKDLDFVITFDGDGQMRAEDALKLLNEAISHNHKHVYGCRNSVGGKAPFKRQVVGLFADILTAFIGGKYVRDTQSGLRCFHRDLISRMALSSCGYSICSEAVIQSLRLKEVPKPVLIGAVYTKYSLSKGQKLTNAFKVASDLLK